MLRTLRNHLLQIRPVLQRRDRQRRAGAQLRRRRRASIAPSPPASIPPSRASAKRPSSTPTTRCAARCTRSPACSTTRSCAALENLVHAVAAHQRLPAAGAAGGGDQGGQRQGRRHGVAAAAVRDLRALAQARRHPPARRHGRARRPALERSPRRLPHRDPRADEDAEAEERDHRPGRVEGRLRAEGPAAAAAGAGHVPDRALPRVRLRPARRHRQPGAAARSCTRPTWSATTTTMPTSSSPPTRARRTSPTPPTRCRRNTASGSATRSRRAAATATTTSARGSRRAAPGSASATTSATSASTCRRSRSPASASATWPATSSATALLRSQATRLVAAFNHQHLFLDPTPDPETSFAERARLFALPRSTWKDYDPAAISEGGGIFERAAKEVPLSPQARTLLGLDDEAPSGEEVVRAILSAQVDLLYNGGIGTYVKASTEEDADVGDRANDRVRVDATAVRARVIGEGGNLGLTQRARLEFWAARRQPATPTPSTTPAASTCRITRSTSRSCSTCCCAPGSSRAAPPATTCCAR